MTIHNVPKDSVRPVRWDGEQLQLLDQRLLPAREVYLAIPDCASAVNAIRDMVVRGAPAIGITAAFGYLIAVRDALQRGNTDWKTHIQADIQALLAARPTAVNLFWAVDQMQQCADRLEDDPVPALQQCAEQILADDLQANYLMGAAGAGLLPDSCSVLTHCNAGALATAGYGTALGVVRSAAQAEKVSTVYVSETRPWLQGSRLTLWELAQESIPATLITESTAAQLMQAGKVDCVIVGADRVAANGDVANKIGTYMHAVCAREHGIRFMVVAPVSTVDINTPSGADIEIEHRDGGEILAATGSTSALSGTSVYNPVFDITPARLVDVFVTEKGVIERPDTEQIRALFE